MREYNTKHNEDEVSMKNRMAVFGIFAFLANIIVIALICYTIYAVALLFAPQQNQTSQQGVNQTQQQTTNSP